MILGACRYLTMSVRLFGVEEKQEREGGLRVVRPWLSIWSTEQNQA